MMNVKVKIIAAFFAASVILGIIPIKPENTNINESTTHHETIVLCGDLESEVGEYQ